VSSGVAGGSVPPATGGSVAPVVVGVPLQPTTMLINTTSVINFTNAFISSSLRNWNRVGLNIGLFAGIFLLFSRLLSCAYRRYRQFGDDTMQSAPVCFTK
jgi:hypothetical protein